MKHTSTGLPHPWAPRTMPAATSGPSIVSSDVNTAITMSMFGSCADGAHRRLGLHGPAVAIMSTGLTTLASGATTARIACCVASSSGAISRPSSMQASVARMAGLPE